MFNQLNDDEYRNLRRIVHAHDDKTIIATLKSLRDEHNKLIQEIAYKFNAYK